MGTESTTKVERFHVTDKEMTDLIRNAPIPIDFSFGPSGVWIEWQLDQPMPWAVERIALTRGVLNENTQGLGI